VGNSDLRDATWPPGDDYLAYDERNRRHLANQLVVSHDNGYTWAQLIDTGHMAQSSSLLFLGGEYLLSIHAHRAEDPGIYVRLIDFSDDQWKVVDELAIWGFSAGQQTRDGQSMAEMFGSIRFGQPSLLRLSNGEFLASHWSIEDGQGKIRVHRLHVDTAGLGVINQVSEDRQAIQRLIAPGHETAEAGIS